MTDKLTELLTEFDEMGYAPTTLTAEPEKAASEWKKRLVAAIKAYIAHLEAENAELQEKDIKCADSVDEMIAMCDKCGLHECCGCEHSYSAVQGVKELKTERKAYEVASNQYRIWFEEQKHRAEVAEKALKIATELGELCAPVEDYIKQAEKELAEERKDD